MLRSDLCDYSDAYIVVKMLQVLMQITRNKNDVLFRSCITKINNTFIDRRS